DHATEQENYFKTTCTPLTYRAAATNGLLSLRKRPLAENETDTGIFPEWQIIAPKDLTWENLVHSIGELRNWGYCLEIPTSDGKGDELGHDRVCDRCAERFIVSKDKWQSCTYHPARPVYKKVDGTRITTWPCCEQTGTGCVVGHTHVFKITHEPRLAAYQPYRQLPMRRKESLDVAALDCEMVYTTASMELARVSVISSQGDILLDRFVKPAFPVLDLNTTYSGVMQHNLDGAISFEEMHQQLIHIGMHRDTILIGHGLDNDLTALRLVHHRVIDSAILFPHPRGRPYRLKLKDLSSRYLARQIQVNDSATGHDPTEDALAALDLVRWRLVN
ncbi:ribonuclease H-like domain-containing protein, partial [Protomyces lactucae-debilis]